MEDTGDNRGHDDAILQSSNKVLTSTILSSVIETKHGLETHTGGSEIEVCKRKMFVYRKHIQKHINSKDETKHAE